MGTFAAIVSCVGSVSSIARVFDANTYDPDTFEMVGVSVGDGDLSDDRAYERRALDYQGRYVTVPPQTVAWHGARWDNGVAYADDGTGTLLDPLPRVMYTPAAVSRAKTSETFSEWALLRLEFPLQISATPSPIDGSDAYDITADTQDAAHYLRPTASVDTPTGRLTTSAICKADGLDWFRLTDVSSSTGTNANQYFDVATGVIGSSAGAASQLPSSVEALADGFFRIAINNNTNSYNGVSYSEYLAQEDGNISFQGNGASGVILASIQIETNVLTPPIKTSNNDTTSVDSCKPSYLASNHDDTAGTYLFEFDAKTEGEDSFVLANFLMIVGTSMRLTDGANNADVDLTGLSAPYKIGFTYGGGQMQLTVNSIKSGVQPYNGTLLSGEFDLSRDAICMGYYGRIQRYAESSESIVDSWM